MARLERSAFARVRATVAARIRELRRARGLSQEELADQAGCHRTYIGMLERGEGNPSLSVLTSIAEALDIEVAELVTAGRKVG